MIKRYRIYILIGLFISIFLLAYNWDRINMLNNNCSINIGDNTIRIQGITSKCYIQQKSPEKLWVFTSEKRIYLAVCGSGKEHPRPLNPDWGFTFIHYEKGYKEPRVSSWWHEYCARFGSNPTPNYLKSTSSYIVPQVGNYSDYDPEVSVQLINDYQNSELRLLSPLELNALVSDYKNAPRE